MLLVPHRQSWTTISQFLGPSSTHKTFASHWVSSCCGNSWGDQGHSGLASSVLFRLQCQNWGHSLHYLGRGFHTPVARQNSFHGFRFRERCIREFPSQAARASAAQVLIIHADDVGVVLPFLFNPDTANLGAKVTFIFWCYLDTVHNLSPDVSA